MASLSKIKSKLQNSSLSRIHAVQSVDRIHEYEDLPMASSKMNSPLLDNRELSSEAKEKIHRPRWLNSISSSTQGRMDRSPFESEPDVSLPSLGSTNFRKPTNREVLS